ncbi:MAG: RDD family protein [Campylobacterota bacterium]
MNQEQLQDHLYREGINVADTRKRVFSYAIDDFLISFIFVIIFWDAIAQAESMVQTMAIINSAFLQIVIVKILYHTFFIYQYGASLGKIAMKIRVLEVQTLDTPSFMAALTRAIFRVVSEVIFYLGFIIAFFDKNRQTLHDKVAKCVVVDV